MTEHERRVNDRDIKAYENNDTRTLNAKIPGFKSLEHDAQDRYIDKSLGNAGMTIDGRVSQASANRGISGPGLG